MQCWWVSGVAEWGVLSHIYDLMVDGDFTSKCLGIYVLLERGPPQLVHNDVSCGTVIHQLCMVHGTVGHNCWLSCVF